MMLTERETLKLGRSQWTPVFIPVSTSVRCFKQIFGTSWAELTRVDITDASTTDAFSYDDRINVALFHPSFIGNTVQIEYTHFGVPNPGIVDLLPSMIAEQARFNRNSIVSGLYVVREYVEGVVTGWNGQNISLSPGLVRLEGDVYHVGGSFWDLNKMGGQAGGDIVTAAAFFLKRNLLSDVQIRSHLIESPRIVLSARYLVDNGGGISSALNSLQQKIGDTRGGYVEMLKCIVVSRSGGVPPDLTFYHDPRFRVPSIY